MQPPNGSKPGANRRHLPLVTAGDELAGKTPQQFERTAHLCAAGDPDHRGLVHACAALASRALQQCIAPSARVAAEAALLTATAWARDEVPYRAVRDARAALFAAGPEIERAVLAAVSQGLGEAPPSALAQHANETVRRYVALGVHHALAAALLCLDGVGAKLALVDVPAEVAAAIAFRDVGLSAARDEGLRARALERARWEYERVQQSASQGVGPLTLQLFHEFLGVHFTARATAQELYNSDFLGWLFPAPVRSR